MDRHDLSARRRKTAEMIVQDERVGANSGYERGGFICPTILESVVCGLV